MPYFEVKPQEKSLSSLVECFWVYQAELLSSVSDPKQQILPDGCTDIIYTFPSIINHAKGRNVIQHSFIQTDIAIEPKIVGTMTSSMSSSLTSGFDYLGIRFQPGGIYPFINVPLHLFTDQSIPVDSINVSLGSLIQERLFSLTDWPQRFNQLELLLTKQLNRIPFQSTPISPLVEEIVNHRGQLPIKQLSLQTQLSQRQMERLFKQYVGISPKLLSRIIRFRHITRQIKNNRTDSLMGIAFSAGYTDHAHLTKDFKAFSGLTPSDFLAH